MPLPHSRSQVHILAEAADLDGLERLRFHEASQSQRTQSRAPVLPDQSRSDEPMYLVYATTAEQTRCQSSTALDENLGQALSSETTKSFREIERNPAPANFEHSRARCGSRFAPASPRSLDIHLTI